MIRHYCDVCGTETTRDNGIITEQEFTIDTEFSRLSILVNVSGMNVSSRNEEPAAICAACLNKRFNQWATEVVKPVTP